MDYRTHIPEALKRLWTVLHAEAPTYLVGGAVRDLLRGVPAHDWDLATRLRPDEVRVQGQQHGYRVVPTGIRFGTVTVLTECGPVEVTTFRQDGRYVDGRHPQAVTFADTIENDLSRRDLTINAMALRIDGSFIDLYGGAQDLARRQIMTVGRPEYRFGEDPLRMLRAVRFTGMDGGEFQLAPSVFDAIRRLKPMICHVSRERQRDELMKILAQPNVGRAVAILDQTGLLGVIWPEWIATRGFAPGNPDHTKAVHEHLIATAVAGPTPFMRLVGLLHDIAKPSCFFVDENGLEHFFEHDHVGAQYAERMLRHLAFDHAAIARAAWLIDQHLFPWDDAGDKAIRRMIRKYGEEAVNQLLALRQMDEAGSGREWKCEAKVRQRVTHLLSEESATERRLAISGRDVMRIAGIREGPEVGRILRRLQDWVDEDTKRNEYPQLVSRLIALLSR